MAASAEEQMANQEIREWARDNGWAELSDSGRIPAAVRAAYEAFSAAAGPDFGAAAAALGLEIGASPLDDDAAAPEDAPADGGGSLPPPPEAPPAAAAAAPAPDPALPPVASLEDARARVAAAKAQPAWAAPPGGKQGQQPPPGGRTRKTRAKAPPPPEPDRLEATPERLADMHGKITSLLLPPVRWWQMTDPVCGGAAAELGPDIVQAWLPVMARSQAVLKLFATDALYFQLAAAVMATWPLIETIYDHHWSEEAQKRRRAQANQAQADQQAAEDLTMYPSTPVVHGHVPAYRPAQAQM